MRRSQTFVSQHREPGQPGFELKEETVSGPLPFFNPTRARLNIEAGKPSTADVRKDQDSSDAEQAPAVSTGTPQIEWRSRDNRKGRHMLVVSDPSQLHSGVYSATAFKAVMRGIWRMFTVVPYWDVSYLIAVFFTIGCAIFIVSGLFYWLPLADPASEFPNESSLDGGVLSFVGATLFQIGAVMLVFEAFNENQTGCFGWALEHVFSNHSEGEGHLKAKPDPNSCQHHHQVGMANAPSPASERGWKWLPTWKEFSTHYIYEIGFVASAAMTIGATIFYVSGICSLPWIIDAMSLGVQQGVYWFTYLLGGIFFILSSLLYVVETQKNWYTPAPGAIGWHIGFWNLIGSVGWTLSAAFGYCQAEWCSYQSDLSLIWASFAFLVGSLLLWYEALDKYPVAKDKQMK